MSWLGLQAGEAAVVDLVESDAKDNRLLSLRLICSSIVGMGSSLSGRQVVVIGRWRGLNSARRWVQQLAAGRWRKARKHTERWDWICASGVPVLRVRRQPHSTAGTGTPYRGLSNQR